MKIEQTSLKLFLTNGVTLTVKDDEKIMLANKEITLADLGELIESCMEDKEVLIFNVTMKHKYDDEKFQEISHHYVIPSERISWYMIEEI